MPTELNDNFRQRKVGRMVGGVLRGTGQSKNIHDATCNSINFDDWTLAQNGSVICRTMGFSLSRASLGVNDSPWDPSHARLIKCGGCRHRRRQSPSVSSRNDKNIRRSITRIRFKRRHLSLLMTARRPPLTSHVASRC